VTHEADELRLVPDLPPHEVERLPVEALDVRRVIAHLAHRERDLRRPVRVGRSRRRIGNRGEHVQRLLGVLGFTDHALDKILEILDPGLSQRDEDLGHAAAPDGEPL
jgi:hypothetical protein